MSRRAGLLFVLALAGGCGSRDDPAESLDDLYRGLRSLALVQAGVDAVAESPPGWSLEEALSNRLRDRVLLPSGESLSDPRWREYVRALARGLEAEVGLLPSVDFEALEGVDPDFREVRVSWRGFGGMREIVLEMVWSGERWLIDGNALPGVGEFR